MPSATAIGVTNMAYPVLNQEGYAVAVLNCPFLERIDDLKVPKIAEVHNLYKNHANQLTEFYSGVRALQDESKYSVPTNPSLKLTGVSDEPRTTD